MKTYLGAFLVALACSLILTPLVRGLAHRLRLFDVPVTGRKIHSRLVPRFGGLAVVPAFVLPLAALFFLRNDISAPFTAATGRVVALFGGAIAMCLVGAYDDFRRAGAGVKLTAQVLVAVAAYYLGYRIELVANPFGGPLLLGVFALPVTVIWIVGIVNAINLIDGLDGLAAGVSILVAAALFVLGFMGPQTVVAVIALSLAGALLGFLVYNFHPASVFLGDSGSLSIGYVLAVTALHGSYKGPTTVALLTPLLLLGLPILDTSLAILRRYRKGANIFTGDKEHLHHRLLDLGFSQRQAVVILYAACGAFVVAALALRSASTLVATVLLGLLGVATLGASLRLGYGRYFAVSRMQNAHPRAGDGAWRRCEIRRIVRTMRHASSPDSLWEGLLEVAAVLQLDGIELRFSGSSPREPRSWRSPEASSLPGESNPGRFGRVQRYLLGTPQAAAEFMLMWVEPDGGVVPALVLDGELVAEAVLESLEGLGWVDAASKEDLEATATERVGRPGAPQLAGARNLAGRGLA